LQTAKNTLKNVSRHPSQTFSKYLTGRNSFAETNNIKATMTDEVDAFALLSEEMTTDEVHLKVNAIHRLKIVILSMG
jgi:hypothetical protein